MSFTVSVLQRCRDAESQPCDFHKSLPRGKTGIFALLWVNTFKENSKTFWLRILICVSVELLSYKTSNCCILKQKRLKSDWSGLFGKSFFDIRAHKYSCMFSLQVSAGSAELLHKSLVRIKYTCDNNTPKFYQKGIDLRRDLKQAVQHIPSFPECCFFFSLCLTESETRRASLTVCVAVWPLANAKIWSQRYF